MILCNVLKHRIALKVKAQPLNALTVILFPTLKDTITINID